MLSYQRRKGIIIHETSIVVYAQLLTGNRYQLNQNGEVYLEKQWSKQVLPFVYQTVVKVNTQFQYLLALSSFIEWREKHMHLLNKRMNKNMHLKLMTSSI